MWVAAPVQKRGRFVCGSDLSRPQKDEWAFAEFVINQIARRVLRLKSLGECYV